MTSPKTLRELLDQLEGAIDDFEDEPEDRSFHRDVAWQVLLELGDRLDELAPIP